jgi:hypothetical protein
MIVTRIFADDRGETHFADIELPLTLISVAVGLPPMRVSPSIPLIRLQLFVVPSARDWHPAPARQFVLLLKGELEVEVSDGERRAFAQGSIAFVEDTQGKGHKDHAINADELLLALMTVPDEMTVERLMDRDTGAH